MVVEATWSEILLPELIQAHNWSLRQSFLLLPPSPPRGYYYKGHEFQVSCDDDILQGRFSKKELPLHQRVASHTCSNYSQSLVWHILLPLVWAKCVKCVFFSYFIVAFLSQNGCLDNLACTWIVICIVIISGCWNHLPKYRIHYQELLPIAYLWIFTLNLEMWRRPALPFQQVVAASDLEEVFPQQLLLHCCILLLAVFWWKLLNGCPKNYSAKQVSVLSWLLERRYLSIGLTIDIILC